MPETQVISEDQKALWEKANHLVGEQVIALSSESGVRIGLCHGMMTGVAGNILLREGTVQLKTEAPPNSYSYIDVFNLLSVDAVVMEFSRGDATSHGATWQNFHTSLEAFEREYKVIPSDPRTAQRHLDHLVGMAAEGVTQSAGTGATMWQVFLNIFCYLRDLAYDNRWINRLDQLVELAQQLKDWEDQELRRRMDELKARP